MNWLLSYEHSGSNWIRYCVEYFSGLPTEGRKKLYDKGKIILRRPGHRAEGFKQIKSEDKLILLIRNYKELIYRGFPDRRERNQKSVLDNYNSYFNLYNELDCHKNIFYYEDIVSDLDEIKHILEFYDIDVKKNWESFKSKESYHRERSFKFGLPHFSNGEPLIYSLNEDTNEKDHIDKLFEDTLGNNFKYIERYKETI